MSDMLDLKIHLRTSSEANYFWVCGIFFRMTVRLLGSVEFSVQTGEGSVMHFKDDCLEAGHKTILSLKKPGVQTPHADMVANRSQFQGRLFLSFKRAFGHMV